MPIELGFGLIGLAIGGAVGLLWKVCFDLLELRERHRDD